MFTRSLIALAAAAAMIVPTTAVAAPPDIGSVVYSQVTVDKRVYVDAEEKESVKDPVGGLFAARPVSRGSRINQLTENPADSQPDFSADGRLIAFVRDGDVFTMRADGSGLRQLTSGAEVDSRPLIAPDGKYLVFERRADSDAATRDLYRVRLLGGTPTAVTTSPEDDHEAAFAADGKSLVFVRSVGIPGGPTADDLYSVRPSGQGLARLTRTTQIDEYAPRHYIGGIAYSRGDSGPGESAYADIYTMRPDGRKVRELIAGAGSSYVEDVTPNGALVLFRRDRGLWVKQMTPETRGKSRKAVVPRARKLLAIDDGSTTSGVFSSDGLKVALFQEARSDIWISQTISVIDVATRRSQSVVSSAFPPVWEQATLYDSAIAWQPVR